MFLIIKLICKECYIEKYGELPMLAYGPRYQLTKEKKKCETCGKEDYLVHTLVEGDKNAKYDFNK